MCMCVHTGVGVNNAPCEEPEPWYQAVSERIAMWAFKTSVSYDAM